MATTIGTVTPYKLGSPPDFGTLYSGRALEFDGVGDYFSGSNVPISTTATYATWLKVVDISGVKDFFKHGGDIFIRVVDATFKVITNGVDTIETGNIFTADKWHHVVFTASGTTFKMYLDGVEKTLVDDSAAALNGTVGTLLVGAASAYFDGKMAILNSGIRFGLYQMYNMLIPIQRN